MTARELVLSRSGRVVLEIGDAAIAPGVTVLIGPNGSGKSTLLDAIAGLLEPSQGTLSVLGAEPSVVRRQIAYVLQAQGAPAGLPVTVREIVTLGRAAERGAFGRITAGDRHHVDNAIDRLDLGHLTTRHLSELSGGERQRTFVAQGLAQQADVLLLDEPTAGLDMASMDRIRLVLAEERAAGRTIIVASHDLTDAAAADRVLLVAGRLVASGTPGDVLTREHLAAAYAGRMLGFDDRALVLDEDHHGDDRHDDLEVTAPSAPQPR